MTRLPPLGTLPLHLGHQKIRRKNRLLNAKYSSPLSVFQQCKICTWTIVGFSWLHKTWSGAHWETSRQQDWGTPLSSPKELSLLRTIACHHRRSYHIAKNSNMQKFFRVTNLRKFLRHSIQVVAEPRPRVPSQSARTRSAPPLMGKTFHSNIKCMNFPFQ